MPLRAYHRPTTLAEAIRLKEADPGALFVAGGTDVMVDLRAGAERPTALVSLRGVAGLADIEVGATVRIGALATVADVAAHGGLARACPAVVEAARALGSVQIRSSATVGGNLCNASPCADLAPPLIVHEARALVEGPRGRRTLPALDLFAGPGKTVLEPAEVLVAVELDAPPAGARSAFRKKGRVAMDLALVNAAVLVVMDGDRCARARIAAGAVGPRPLRLRKAEAEIEGAAPTDERVRRAREAAAAEVLPISDVRASADYRRHMTGVLVERAVRALLDGRSA